MGYSLNGTYIVGLYVSSWSLNLEHGRAWTEHTHLHFEDGARRAINPYNISLTGLESFLNDFPCILSIRHILNP